MKAIVLDFDGVVVRGSEFGKNKAWLDIFPADLKGHVDAAREKFSGGKGSRFDIIRELGPVCGILESDTDDWVARKAEEFGKFTFEFTIREGVLPEDFKALEGLCTTYPLYLNSATPESVLSMIADRLKVSQFFRGIYGQRNQRSKVENMERAGADSEASPSEVLFVGDQDTDVKIAETFGCHFVGVMNDWNKWKIGDRPFSLIPALKDLPDFIRSL